MATQKGKSMAQVARELGLSGGVLYQWYRQLREEPETAFLGKGHQSDPEEENRRLRRDLERAGSTLLASSTSIRVALSAMPWIHRAEFA